MKTTDRGLLSEASVQLRLIQLGVKVLVPVGHDHGFDLVAHAERRFCRIQVKTARRGSHRGKPNGVLLVNGYSVVDRVGGKRTKRLTEADCDAIVAYDPTDGRCYVLKPGLGRITLRLAATGNQQARKVRWAHDHELTSPDQLFACCLPERDGAARED